MSRPNRTHGPLRARYEDGAIARRGDVVSTRRGRPGRVERIKHGVGHLLVRPIEASESEPGRHTLHVPYWVRVDECEVVSS